MTFDPFDNPFFKSIESMNRALGLENPIFKSIESMNRALGLENPIFKSIESMNRALGLDNPVFRSIESAQRIAESFLRLGEEERRTLLALANEGWYIDPDAPMSEMREAAELFANGDKAKGNEMMCALVEQALDATEATLCTEYPHRAKILKPAFGAHRRREYALSVPVFLAQVDGICEELHGFQLHARKGARMKLATELQVSEHDIYLAPLADPSPISHNEHERTGTPHTLNRHAVLHGESVDYDNQEDACRAVSYIRYVSWILKIQKDEEKRPNQAIAANDP